MKTIKSSVRIRIKNLFFVVLVISLSGISLTSCSFSNVNRSSDPRFSLRSIIKPGEPIAIMPFESENALSNLGGLISDEITANLVENVPGIKIIPTSVTRSFLLNSSTPISGIPDLHSIHSLKEGLKCRYLLTGNFYSSIGDIIYSNSFTNTVATGSATVRLIDCDSVTVVWAKHFQDSYEATTYYSSSGEVQYKYFTEGQLMQELIKRLGKDIAEYFYLNE